MKSNARTRRLLATAQAHLDALKAGLAEHARENWREWSGLDGGGGGKGNGVSNPTERGALWLAEHEDNCARDWAAFDADIEQGVLAFARAERAARGAIKLEGKKLAGPKGCRLCELAGRDGEPHPNGWQKVYSLDPPSHRGVGEERRFVPEEERVPVLIVGGVVRGRCSWHFDFAERWGADAVRELTLWHLDRPGSKLPRSEIERWQPGVLTGEPSRRAS